MDEGTARFDLLWETIQEREDYPIYRLVYLSRPTKPFTDEDFDDIERKSVEANNLRDVTGLLIVDGDRVLQILEGRESAVKKLFDKIEADTRHTVVKLIGPVKDDVRLLMTWNMVVRGMSGTPANLMEQFTEFYDQFLNAGPEAEISIEQVELFKTISLFGSLALTS
ncbi:MAG: BLUF domain-containing protein [Akkermansiaceae bacterium]|jgi:hypothetical protein